MRWVRHLLTALILGLAVQAHAQDKVLNVYNWTDYIDPKVLERFTAETGIKVQYDIYDSLETLEGKMLAGHSGYDIIVPTSEPTFSRLIKAGALQPLDKAKIPNLKNLDPALMERVAVQRSRQQVWRDLPLGHDRARDRSRTRSRRWRPNAPMDSWDLLFKPENAKRLAPCGIMMMDSAIDTIPTRPEIPRPATRTAAIRRIWRRSRRR